MTEINLNVDQVLESISQFDIPGWDDLKKDQVKLSPVGCGYINTTCKVERLNHAEGLEDENSPKSLIYKVYGGNKVSEEIKNVYHINSPFVQSYIFSEMSNRGWGPRLYGLLDEPFGRVEEFIDSRTLRHGEAFDDETLSADVAKAYARFHSVKLPLPHRKDSFCLSRMQENMIENRVQAVEWAKSIKLSESDREHVDAFLNFPIFEEHEWATRNCQAISHRVVLCNMDPSYLNRLVRNVEPCDENVTRSLIIDLDLTTYNHRGFDLGGHFACRLFDWSTLDNLESGYSFPSESQQSHFLSAYLEECKQVFSDFDGESLDSLDHLTMEVMLYSAIYLLSIISYSLRMHTNDPDFVVVSFNKLAIAQYKKLKEKYIREYSHVVC